MKQSGRVSARGSLQPSRVSLPVVDHTLDARDVQTARSHIRGNQQRGCPNFKRSDSLSALPLRHVALDLLGTPAAAAKPLTHTRRLDQQTWLEIWCEDDMAAE